MDSNRDPCPPPEVLADAAVGAPTDAVRRHLELGCADCAARLARIDRAVAALRDGALPEVPPAWLRRAAALPDSASGPRTDRPAYRGLPSVRPPRPAVALRGAAAAHRVHRAGPFAVELALADSGALLGQVLPDGDEPAGPGYGTAFGAQRVGEVVIDALGVFRLARPPRGLRALALELPGADLHLTDLRLKSDGG